ncbi:MAG: 2-C-methyl-D-erythritol 4-phosphate cytidylyltransferase [Verrucomicrobiota bacterium]|nr:2-C-methyl-D-erythritol 4-phosphate cytidylyltransferase [Chthoniobacterales bacterium]MDQ3414401.1 2-C-methyl-D-erythritol 4-phosphate cytidylyltransferase [Verrucomicrobiota bacterium]
MLSAIIVAGGRSQRMGFDKLLASLAGRSVVAHSIAAFEQTKSVTDIILVGRAERLSAYEKIVALQGFGKVSAIIPGGARRQDSVRCGLQKLPAENDFVAVHDAARPLVRPEMIEQIFQLARRHGGAASAAPVSDTLKRVDRELAVIGGVERADLFAVQTPQIFQRELLEKAYAAIFEAGLDVTDEISAVERAGGRVVLLPNEEPNFKITWPADLPLAEFVLRQRAV